MTNYLICGECGQEYDTKAPHEDFCPGAPAGVNVVADLERRILALEDAHAAVQAELADHAKANREATGLLVDIAAPARKVIDFVDGQEPFEARIAEIVLRLMKSPKEEATRRARQSERRDVVTWLRQQTRPGDLPLLEPVALAQALATAIERGDHRR